MVTVMVIISGKIRVVMVGRRVIVMVTLLATLVLTRVVMVPIVWMVKGKVRS